MFWWTPKLVTPKKIMYIKTVCWHLEALLDCYTRLCNWMSATGLLEWIQKWSLRGNIHETVENERGCWPEHVRSTPTIADISQQHVHLFSGNLQDDTSTTSTLVLNVYPQWCHPSAPMQPPASDWPPFPWWWQEALDVRWSDVRKKIIFRFISNFLLLYKCSMNVDTFNKKLSCWVPYSVFVSCSTFNQVTNLEYYWAWI